MKNKTSEVPIIDKTSIIDKNQEFAETQELDVTREFVETKELDGTQEFDNAQTLEVSQVSEDVQDSEDTPILEVVKDVEALSEDIENNVDLSSDIKRSDKHENKHEIKEKPVKKFKFGQFFAKLLLFTVFLIACITLTYLNFSRINIYSYEPMDDFELAKSIFKEENGKYSNFQLEDYQFNQYISRIIDNDNPNKAKFDLPFDIQIENIVYYSANKRFVASISGTLINTSLILENPYYSEIGKLKLQSLSIGSLEIPINMISTLFDFSDFFDKIISPTPIIKTENAILSQAGLNITYKINDMMVKNLKFLINNSLDKAFRSDDSSANINEAKSVIEFSKNADSNKSDPFIFNTLTNTENMRILFACTDKSDDKKIKTLIDAILENIGIYNEKTLLDLSETSKDKQQKYHSMIEVERLKLSLKEQSDNIELIRGSNKELAEKLDKLLTPETIKWSSIEASSTLVQDGKSFDISNISDNNNETAWASDVNRGIGESIMFKSETPLAIAKFKIKNGSNEKDEYEKRNRITKILVELSNGSNKIFGLNDTNREFQSFEINEYGISWIRVTILSLAPGSETQNQTFITEMNFEVKKSAID